MVAVNRNADVICGGNAGLLRFALDIGQQASFSGFLELGAALASLEKPRRFELDNNVVVATVLLGPLGVEVDVKCSLQRRYPT